MGPEEWIPAFAGMTKKSGNSNDERCSEILIDKSRNVMPEPVRLA